MNKFEIVDDAEVSERADYIVCAVMTTPLMLPDNKVARCSECGTAVQHRPDVAPNILKICFPCIAPQLADHLRNGDLHVMATKTTVGEVAAYLKKHSN